jgi:Flp pilus assembly protein TadG
VTGRTRRRVRDEEGSALVEFTWLALILIVPLVWIVVSVFEVQRGSFAATAAARTAARAYALAPDDARGRQRADAAVRQVLDSQGTSGQAATVSVRCTTDPDCHAPTSVITVTVRSGVALPLSPEILGSRAASFSITSTHTVPIGQYAGASQ